MNIDSLIHTYKNGLLNDIMPFWLNHAPDREFGGYITSLDRDGRILDTDKSVWMQGRFAWLLSTLYHHVEPRENWLEAAELGVRFLRDHCFDSDGVMFFQVTREGKPLRKRRHRFSEVFAIIAYAAYAQATGDARAAEDAARIFKSVNQQVVNGLSPKVNSVTRPTRGFAWPMLMLNVCQILREALHDESYTVQIDRHLEEIQRYFLNAEHRAVLEICGPNGELIDHFDGRTLNPGHAIEGAWFVLNEAKHRGNDPELIRLGTTMLDWMWARGWDEEFGGILYFRDIKGGPVQEYYHDMKFWWPQNEAIIATLLAYQLTGDKKYADWFEKIHAWTFAHFPDPECGEWYGWLHRDGSISSTAKGNLWKGPFHVPRMYWKVWMILEELKLEGKDHATTVADHSVFSDETILRYVEN